MRHRNFLLSVIAAMFLGIGLGVVSHGNEGEKDALTRLVELQSLNRRLKEMTDEMGINAPEVVELRNQVELRREELHKQSVERFDSAHTSQVLQILEDGESTNQQLRESVLILTKELIALRNRVSELERSTTVRIVPLNR